MTSPSGTSGNEPVTAPGIHDMPREAVGPPLTPQQWLGFGTAFVNRILASVLYALAGIQVLGVNPFGFLRAWADDLAKRADDAYNGATVAQGSANTANAGVLLLNNRVNRIEKGGASFYDTFGRDLPDFTQDPDYDVEVVGGSGYPYVTNEQDGRLRWAAVGYSDTYFIARRRTPMGTNRVHIGCVIDDFTYGYAGNQAHIRLMARMDAARQNYVVATIEDGAAQIGYVLNGTYQPFGGAVAVNTSSGDFWDLEVGVDGDDWRFRLSQNNDPKVDRTDLGHLSHMDTTPGVDTGVYLFCAIGGDCAIGAGGFGTTYQIGMPDFQVIAGGEI